MRREVNKSTQVKGNRRVLLAKGYTTLVREKYSTKRQRELFCYYKNFPAKFNC